MKLVRLELQIHVVDNGYLIHYGSDIARGMAARTRVATTRDELDVVLCALLSQLKEPDASSF